MNRIMLDTETTNSIECPLAYDISWTVFDDEYEVLEKRAFVVYETYVLEKELMQSAYYANKLPQYEEAIKNGEKKLATIATIAKIFHNDCKFYNAKTVVAHNAAFDYRSCNSTLRYITKSKNRYFFPFGTEIEDTLRMSRQIFAKDTEYFRYCSYYDFLTKRGDAQCTAEVLYRFLTDNENFEEKHVGIDDCLIEMEIYKECLRRNPNVERSPWKKS